MGTTLATALANYHERYHDKVQVVFDQEGISPTLAAFEVKAESDGEGRGHIFPIEYSPGAVASATFSVSQGKAQGSTVGSGPSYDRFVVQTGKVEAPVVFSRDAIDAARGEAGAMFNVVKKSMNAGMLDIRNQLAQASVEKGYGRVGTLTTTATSSTVTIDPSLVNRCLVGMDIQVAETEAGHVLAGSAASLRITAINENTGALTLSGDPTSTWSGITTGWVIFRKGNRDNSATPAFLLPIGMKTWISSTAVGGVTRTGNPMLTGLAFSASGLDVAAALQKCAAQLFRRGAPEADTAIINVDSFYALASAKDVQKNLAIELGPLKIGFDAIGVYGPNGKLIKVVADANYETGEGYMGPFNHSEFRPQCKYSTPELVTVDKHDGLEFVRLAASTDYEARLYARLSTAVPAAGKYAAISALAVA